MLGNAGVGRLEHLPTRIGELLDRGSQQVVHTPPPSLNDQMGAVPTTATPPSRSARAESSGSMEPIRRARPPRISRMARRSLRARASGASREARRTQPPLLPERSSTPASPARTTSANTAADATILVGRTSAKSLSSRPAGARAVVVYPSPRNA